MAARAQAGQSQGPVAGGGCTAGGCIAGGCTAAGAHQVGAHSGHYSYSRRGHKQGQGGHGGPTVEPASFLSPCWSQPNPVSINSTCPIDAPAGTLVAPRPIRFHSSDHTCLPPAFPARAWKLDRSGRVVHPSSPVAAATSATKTAAATPRPPAVPLNLYRFN